MTQPLLHFLTCVALHSIGWGQPRAARTEAIALGNSRLLMASPVTLGSDGLTCNSTQIQPQTQAKSDQVARLATPNRR
ncbi:MAG: hypothetical protein EA001_09710 [Oscillatoriales cyanobacterium]|nr:MAG: hypothetical protein EA001_09710 [Oscillatoriales cyanobacterium]